MPVLKRSVSSTELLYEKAMARFYKAMELDDREQMKKKSAQASAEAFTQQPMLPPVPLNRSPSRNSIERGMARKSPLRRRLSGEMPEVSINPSETETTRKLKMKLPTYTLLDFQPKRSLYPQESLDDPDYFSHVDDYTDDYTESTESSGESETEKFKRRVREHGRPKTSLTEDELDTYHPRNRMTSPYASPDSDQAVEVLSKPYALPSPDFIPKPILKRPTSMEGDSDDKRSKRKSSKTKTQRKTLSQLFDRKASTAGRESEEKVDNSEGEVDSKTSEVQLRDPEERRGSSSTREKAKQLKMEMRQSSIEEQKVAIDHYSDLVKEKGNWRTATVPLYLNADDLKKAAAVLAADDLEQLNCEPELLDLQAISLDDGLKLSPSARVIKSFKTDVVIQEKNSVADVDREAIQESVVESRGRPPRQIHREPAERVLSTASRPPSLGSRNSSAVRRTGRTPVEARLASKTRERSTSKSPLTVNRRPLAMKGDISERRSPTPRPMTPREELQQQQEIDTKVKSTMSYTTDCVLFVVACWVYLFKDARVALPIVLLLVYRHIRDHIPRWWVRKLN